MSSGIKALLQGSAILAISNISLKAINFFLLPLYTTHLTSTQLGITDTVANLSSLVLTVLVLALDGAYSTFFYDEDSEEYRKKIFSTVWITLAAGSLLCLVVMFFSPLISTTIFGTDEYAAVICISLFGVGMQLWALPYALDLRIRNKMTLFSVVTVTGAAVAVALNVLFVVVLNLGYYAMIISSALTATLQVLLYRILCKKQASFKAYDISLIKAMLKYSIPLMPATISFWVINLSCTYIMLRYSTVAEVGIYGIANRFATVLTTVTSAVQVSYTAYAFQTLGTEGAENKFVRIVNAYFLFVALICFTVSIYGKEIVTLMTTPEYWRAYEFLPGIMFGQLAYTLSTFFGYGISFVKKSYYSTISSLVAALVSVTLNFALIPHLGGLGASISALGSYIVIAVFQYVFAERLYPCGYEFWRIAGGFIVLLGIVYLSLMSPLWVKIALWLAGLAMMALLFKSSIGEMRTLVTRAFRRSSK